MLALTQACFAGRAAERGPAAVPPVQLQGLPGPSPAALTGFLTATLWDPRVLALTQACCAGRAAERGPAAAAVPPVQLQGLPGLAACTNSATSQRAPWPASASHARPLQRLYGAHWLARPLSTAVRADLACSAATGCGCVLRHTAARLQAELRILVRTQLQAASLLYESSEPVVQPSWSCYL